MRESRPCRDGVHATQEAREKLDDLSEYIRATSVKLEKVVADDDLDALGVMMALFKTIRERESGPLAAF